MILQNPQFSPICVQKMILYQIVVKFRKKTVSFEDIVRFIDEENISIYVALDCGITFYLEPPTKNRQFNWERNYISRSCEKPKCIPSNHQHNCSSDEQHSSSSFLDPSSLKDMVPAALMSLNHILRQNIFQPTTRQPRTDSCPVFSSLRTMDSKRKGLRVRFAFFQKKTPIGRTNEGNSRYGWRVEWSLQTKSNWRNSAICDELLLFLNLAICFTCLTSIVCWCNICRFFENLAFLFPFFDDFDRAVKIHWHFVCKVTLP